MPPKKGSRVETLSQRTANAILPTAPIGYVTHPYRINPESFKLEAPACWP